LKKYAFTIWLVLDTVLSCERENGLAKARAVLFTKPLALLACAIRLGTPSKPLVVEGLPTSPGALRTNTMLLAQLCLRVVMVAETAMSVHTSLTRRFQAIDTRGRRRVASAWGVAIGPWEIAGDEA
jgi:hypothetical protein